MSEQQAASLSRYWMIFSIQAVFIPLIAIFIVFTGMAEERVPAFGQYLLVASMPVIAFAAWLTQGFRDTQAEVLQHANPDAQLIARLRRKMLIAISIADIPATLAMLYLLFTGDYKMFAVLCASSYALLYFLKPAPALADK